MTKNILKLAIAGSLAITSATAMAQTAPEQLTKAEVVSRLIKQTDALSKLSQELGSLREQIKQSKQNVENGKMVRNIGLAVTAGGVLGFVLTSKKMYEAGGTAWGFGAIEPPVKIGIPSAIALVGGVITASSGVVKININEKNIDKLDAALAAKQKEIEEKQNENNVLKELLSN